MPRHKLQPTTVLRTWKNGETIPTEAGLAPGTADDVSIDMITRNTRREDRVYLQVFLLLSQSE
jgi:hypothetical protein